MLYSNLPDLSRNSSGRYSRAPAPRSMPSIPAQWHQPVVVVPTRRTRRFMLAAVIAALGGYLLLFGINSQSGVIHALSNAVEQRKADEAAQTAAAAAAVAKKARLQTYETTVNQIIAAHPDQDIAVSSIDVSDNSLTSLGDDGTFTGASTAKLITAIAVLHEIESGDMTLNDKISGVSVQTLLKKMVVNSDNNAWEALNAYLTHATLQDYMTSLGWTKYDPDVNTFVPAEMARLIQQFYEGKLVNGAHKALLLSYMKQSVKQDYIVDSVQSYGSDFTVYHKAGWLDGLMHDVAIISNGKTTIVLTIYTYTGYTDGDNADNQATFKAITQAALAAYFPAS